MARARKNAEGRRRSEAATSTGGTRAGDPSAIPGWVPWIVFPVLTLVLFGAFVFSDRMLYGSDTLSLGYMARDFYANAVRGGDFPLWNPYLLGGVPFLEGLSGGDSLYPTALLLFVMAPYRALGWKLVLHVALAGGFMYGWTRGLGARRGGALVAGVAYLLAPFMVSLVYPGHDGKIFVTALTPLLFWAMEGTFSRRGLLPYTGVAAVVALVILTTHFQMAYFLFGAAGLYYAFRCVQLARGDDAAVTAEAGRRRGPRAAAAGFALFLGASVLGAAVAGIQLIPAVRYATDFSRRTATTTAAAPEANKAYAAQWSLHPEEVAALVVPEFVGANVSGADWTANTYWGRNFFKLNHEYAGLVVLLLAGVSFFGAPRRGVRWFLVGLGGLALLYALGAHTPVWHLAYGVLPGVRLFRAASMVAFLFGFVAVTLSAFGVDRLLALREAGDEATRRRVLRFLWIATGVLAFGLVLAGGGLLTRAWTALLYADIDAGKAAALAADRPFMVRGFLVAATLAAGTAGLAWAWLRGRLPARGLVVGLTLLVAVDLWRVDAPFVQVTDPAQVTRPDALVAELVRREATEPPFRASRIGVDQDVGPATFGVALAGGHHPNDLASYRELVGMEGSGAAQNLLNGNVLSLLNVRYLIWPTAQQGGEPQGADVVARTNLADGTVYESLLRYPGLPRARLVGAAEVVPEDRQVERILAPDFDPGHTVLLSEPPPIALPGGAVNGEVTWLKEGVDELRLSVETPSNALLVVADNWYPAWVATVDGVEAPVLRAYHTLRAVPVEAGRHEVVLRYDPGFLRAGFLTSVVGVVVLLGVAVLSWAREGRRGGSEAGG